MLRPGVIITIYWAHIMPHAFCHKLRVQQGKHNFLSLWNLLYSKKNRNKNYWIKSIVLSIIKIKLGQNSRVTGLQILPLKCSCSWKTTVENWIRKVSHHRGVERACLKTRKKHRPRPGEGKAWDTLGAKWGTESGLCNEKRWKRKWEQDVRGACRQRPSHNHTEQFETYLIKIDSIWRTVSKESCDLIYVLKHQSAGMQR